MTDDTARFHEAVKEGRTGDVEAMLEATPTLVDADRDGLSPLLLAVFAGHEAVAETLIDRGASVDVWAAAALGSTDRLQSSIDKQGQHVVNEHGSLGWTPLHLAAYMGRRDAVGWLLARGAEVLAVSRNREANTPLHAALAGRGDPAVTDMLLESGADPAFRTHHGVTPLHVAAARGDRATVDRLISAGARPAPMEDGRLPSTFAREHGHPELASILGAIEGGSGEGAR